MQGFAYSGRGENENKKENLRKLADRKSNLQALLPMRVLHLDLASDQLSHKDRLAQRAPPAEPARPLRIQRPVQTTIEWPQLYSSCSIRRQIIAQSRKKESLAPKIQRFTIRVTAPNQAKSRLVERVPR